MIVGVIIGSLEMIKMFEKENPFKLETKIVTIILTIGMYLGFILVY